VVHSRFAQPELYRTILPKSLGKRGWGNFSQALTLEALIAYIAHEFRLTAFLIASALSQIKAYRLYARDSKLFGASLALEAA